MNSRERVLCSLNHDQPDRVPFDFGGTWVGSAHVTVVAKLRQALGLDEPGTPVKVVEPFQMLGEIAPDLIQELQCDVIHLASQGTMYGFLLQDYKSWTMFDGTVVLVPGLFNTEPDMNGDILQYPEGDKSLAPCGRMPKDGWFCDTITRQKPIDLENLDVKDNLEEFGEIDDEVLNALAQEAKRLFRETDKAITAAAPSTDFGDIASVTAPFLRDPKGIRNVADWYMSYVCRPSFIRKVFQGQCEIALANLGKFWRAIGTNIQIVITSCADFGTQAGPLISEATYRELFLPFHRRVNDWVHENTPWKTFMHCCGGVAPLLDSFIEAGFDIFNPVQCSAAGMDPQTLKERFGNRIVFWGGGVDTQKMLPFGTPGEVRAQVRERIRILDSGGGFVFNSIHNIQACTPIENVLAMIESVHEY
jgi:hypothetical protein